MAHIPAMFSQKEELFNFWATAQTVTGGNAVDRVKFRLQELRTSPVQKVPSISSHIHCCDNGFIFFTLRRTISFAESIIRITIGNDQRSLDRHFPRPTVSSSIIISTYQAMVVTNTVNH